MPSKRISRSKIRKSTYFVPGLVVIFGLILVFAPLLIGMHMNPGEQPTRGFDDPTYDPEPTTNPTSSQQTFLDISNIEFTPHAPTTTDPVVVTCTVSYAEDVDTLGNVWLWFDNEIFEENRITMTKSGSTYTAAIPTQIDGTTVVFWISAMTTEGESETTSTTFFTVNDPLPDPEPDPDPDPDPNPDPIAVLWELESFDNYDNLIPDIQTATIRDTVTFVVTIHEGDSIVAFVKLDVTGLDADASPGGTWYFTEVTSTEYELVFDTTIMNDGEYLFEFTILTIQENTQTAGTSDGYWNLPMSSFGFVQGDSGIPFQLIATLIAVMIVIGGTIIYSVKYKHSGRRRKK
jgi:hypothetical protein